MNVSLFSMTLKLSQPSTENYGSQKFYDHENKYYQWYIWVCSNIQSARSYKH